MTEAGWLAATDPAPLARLLRRRASARKVRLLNCAVVRAVPVGPGGETLWELISDRPWFRQRTWRYAVAAGGAVVQTQELITLSCHEAVEIAERAADEPELAALLASAAFATFAARYEAEGEMLGQTHSPRAEYHYRVAQCFETVTGPSGGGVMHWVTPDSRTFRRPVAAACGPAVCALARDIFGNPFRPAVVHPGWLTSDVVALATGIYHERAFDRMPILADALQDAGCDSAEVLDHCRDAAQPHCRGCWVVDLVLGRA